MTLPTKTFLSTLRKNKIDYDELRKTTSREGSESAGAKIYDAINKEKDVSLENGRVTKAYFDRLRMVELGTFIMSLIGVGVSVLVYELEFDETNIFATEFMLWTSFIVSILLVLMTIVRYVLRLEFKKKRNTIPEKATLWTTGEWRFMIAECIIVFIHPSPFLMGLRMYMNTLYDNVEIYYHINDLLGMIQFVRVFVFFRVILLNTYWYSNRSQRLCEMYDCESGYMFSLKCLMRENPAKLVFSCLFMSIPIFAYWIRCSERPYFRTITTPGQWSFNSYLDAMWYIIITLTTVGYGDYFAKTLFGRIYIFFCCIWGSFIISLMVVAMTNILEMSFLESKAYHVLLRLKAKNTMMHHAAAIITRLVRMRFRAKKNETFSDSKIEEIKDYLKEFKSTSRVYRELGNSDNGFEDMNRQFDHLRDEIQDLMKNTKYLMETNKLLMGVLGIDKNVMDKLVSNSQSTYGKSAKSTFLSFTKADEYDREKNIPYKTEASEHS